jgi:phage terminase large subunit-like protein
VRQGLFRHDGNPILRWNASNCCVTRRVDDSLLPKKDHPDSPGKIDGIDAVLLAMGALIRSVSMDSSGSVYDADDYELVIV